MGFTRFYRVVLGFTRFPVANEPMVGLGSLASVCFIDLFLAFYLLLLPSFPSLVALLREFLV